MSNKLVNRLSLWSLILSLAWAVFSAAYAQEPCRDEDIQSPQASSMIETDLALLRGASGQEALPEWSKIEKLRNFYRRYAADHASCTIPEGEDLSLRLYLARDLLAETRPEADFGHFAADNAFQFYGASRFKVEQADKEVTREYAFPIAGAARIADVVEGAQLEILLEDLAQVQMVMVPRIRRGTDLRGGAEGDQCFLVSNVTLVPSRVFDEPPARQNLDSSLMELTLNARRRALEQVAWETRWLQRVDTEEPGCLVEDADGYSDLQIQSLNLTLRELVPEMNFVSQTIRFWRDVEQRISQIRAEDEGWKKEIVEGQP